MTVSAPPLGVAPPGGSPIAMARGNDSIYFTVWASLAVFATLSLVFDAIRKRIWWVYEPRNHHAAFKARTPPPASDDAAGHASATDCGGGNEG